MSFLIQTSSYTTVPSNRTIHHEGNYPEKGGRIGAFAANLFRFDIWLAPAMYSLPPPSAYPDTYTVTRAEEGDNGKKTIYVKCEELEKTKLTPGAGGRKEPDECSVRAKRIGIAALKVLAIIGLTLSVVGIAVVGGLAIYYNRKNEFRIESQASSTPTGLEETDSD